jgi:iron-sulfur cluster assembly enzyme ISCU, mitochondrial
LILQPKIFALKPHHTVTMLSRVVRVASRRAPLVSAAARPSVAPLQQRVSATPTVAAQRHYHEKVLDHYSRPRNVGSMNKKDLDVGTGLVGAPACGDVMKLQIRVDPETNKISDVKFKTFGCGSAIASSSYLTELVRGMSLDDAGKVKNTEIAKELCLPPVKRTYMDPALVTLVILEAERSLTLL